MTTNAMNTVQKLLDGWGVSDAYGGETMYLHDTEVEQIARQNRAGTRDDQHPQGWPSNAEARAAFVPLILDGETLDEFCLNWRQLQTWRDNGALGGAGLESPKAAAFRLWGTMLAIMDICREA